MSNERQDKAMAELQKREDAKAAVEHQDSTGIKVQIRSQIQKDVKVLGKILLYWPMRTAKGYLPDIYPLVLAAGYGTDIETVCRVIADMREQQEIRVLDLGRLATADNLVEYLSDVSTKRASQDKIDIKAFICSPFMLGHKSKVLTAESARAFLS